MLEQQLEVERRQHGLREKQQEHERELWKEKLVAELLVAEKKLEMAEKKLEVNLQKSVYSGEKRIQNREICLFFLGAAILNNCDVGCGCSIVLTQRAFCLITKGLKIISSDLK